LSEAAPSRVLHCFHARTWARGYALRNDHNAIAPVTTQGLWTAETFSPRVGSTTADVNSLAKLRFLALQLSPLNAYQLEKAGDVVNLGYSHSHAPEKLMSQKKRRKLNKRSKARAMPLAVAEPHLREPRTPSRKKTAQVVRLTPKTPVRKVDQTAKQDQTGGEQEMLSAWLPWNVALRQQALATSAFLGFLRMQQQVAQSWFSPATSRSRRG
jgi:hypothetical protein